MDLYIIEYLGYGWHEPSQEYREQWKPYDAPLFGTEDGAGAWLYDNTRVDYHGYEGGKTWDHKMFRIVRVNVTVTGTEVL